MKNVSLFAAQSVLFRAYDIRGSQQLFTKAFINMLAKAFAMLYHTHSIELNNDTEQTQRQKLDTKSDSHKAKLSSVDTATVVIGYDVRCGSDDIAQTLVDILQLSGLHVISLGLVTTPMMAFWAQEYDGHGIMVTASHSSKDILGIKWLVDNRSPSHTEIQALYQQLASANLADPLENSNPVNKQPITYSASQSGLPIDVITTTYIEAIAQVIATIHHSDNHHSDNHHLNKHTAHSTHNVEPLLSHRLFRPNPQSQLNTKLDVTIVIDCLNGATSNIAQPLFERFCQRVIMLNDTADGSFPTGNPDPTEPNRLAELQQTVIINQADLGFAFDGDGDRIMVVDNRGKVVMPDHLLYLLAQVAITERSMADDISYNHSKNAKPAPAALPVLFDIKCSHHLSELLRDIGAEPIMTRTGSSLLRQRLRTDQRQAIFAGELSGHFIFNDGYFIAYDDAMYAGLRLLHWLAYTAIPIAAQVDKIMLTENLWGESRSLLPPYELTDITRSLPTLVSTADHYLPLPNKENAERTIMQQLTAYCHRLQNSSLDTTLSKQEQASDHSTLCDCWNNTKSSRHLGCLDSCVIQANQRLPVGTQFSFIDGIRLDFANGFGVIRESNTSHSLTVRFAGDSLADLKEMQARFVSLCEPIDKHLAEQIAAIHPEG